MRTNKRSREGNVLILTLATIVGLLVVIGAFIVNYNRLLGSRQEAQTAADAAALAVARDLSRIVIDGKHGRIGLIDDTGAGNDLNSRPVTGINTLLATVRLDLLIANQLKNQRIVQLAMQDYQTARQDAQDLRKAIIAAAQGGTVQDKKREALDLVGVAQTVYDDNAHRIGRGKRKGALKVELGYIDDAITGIPTPSPNNLAQVNMGNSVTVNGINYYRANVTINTDVMGNQVPFTFSGSGPNVALVDNSRFHPIADNSEIVPSVIRVTGEEVVELPGSNTAPGSLSHTVAVSATVGGALRYSTSGSLVVSFPQGFPTNSAGLNFDSVNGIMNSNGWNPSSPGLWFEAKGGAYPGNANAKPEPSTFRGEKDTPANIALASMVYDWLRTMGLRPNINSVVTQLNVNLRNLGSKSIASNDTSLWQPAYADCPNMNLQPVTGAIFDLGQDPRGQENFYKNPAQYRAQASHAWGYDPPAGTIAETALITSTDAGGNAISTNGESPSVLMQFYDTLMKMNGVCKETYENATSVMKTDVEDMRQDVVALGQAKTDRTTMLAKIAEQEKSGNATGVSQLKDGVSKLDDTIKDISERLHAKTEKLVRVERVRLNSMYALKVSNQIYENLKGLSGCGVKREAPDHFIVHGIRFLPPTRVASAAEIQGEAEISTGQNNLAPLRDWAAPYKKGKCQLEFFEFPSDIETPIAFNSGRGDSLLDVPALAQSSVPINQSNVFVFYVSGMAGSQAQSNNIFGQMTGSAHAGQIVINRMATTPYPGEDVLEGQLLYQNKQALRTVNGDQSANTSWQAYGRDQVANAAGAYYADKTADGACKSSHDWCQLSLGESLQEGPKCPALACEFSVRCPMVEPETKCVPNVYYLGSASVQAPPTLAKDLVQLADMSDKLKHDPNNMGLRADYVKMLYPYITSLKDTNLQAKQAYDYYIENAPVMAEFYYLLFAHDGVFSGFSFERGVGIDVRKVTPCSLIYVSHI